MLVRIRAEAERALPLGSGAGTRSPHPQCRARHPRAFDVQTLGAIGHTAFAAVQAHLAKLLVYRHSLIEAAAQFQHPAACREQVR